MEKRTIFFLLFLGIFLSFAIRAQSYQVGSIIKDFSLMDVSGKTISMSEYKGAKGFIIVFTSNSCPFSKLYEQRLNELNGKYKGLGYYLIAINPNDPSKNPEDSFENMKLKSSEQNMDYRYLFDEEQRVSALFNPQKTPQAFVVNVENHLFKIVYSGAIDDNASNEKAVKTRLLENAIDELVAGNKVSVQTSKPVGCSVKWKRK
jgi:glutathione peroxidase-family protein